MIKSTTSDNSFRTARQSEYNPEIEDSSELEFHDAQETFTRKPISKSVENLVMFLSGVNHRQIMETKHRHDSVCKSSDS